MVKYCLACLFLLLFLSTCASDGPGYVNQSDLEPYYALFEHEGRIRGADVSRATHVYRVDVNNEYWIGAGEYQRRAIVFNRLGVSVLGRPYSDAEDVRGLRSLMHSQVYEFSEEALERGWNELVDELF
jgi:hypothetical protein